MRYEKKYRIEAAHYGEVLERLHQSSAAFRMAFPDRYVNSIYYDDVQLSAFYDNLSGISDRVKHRIRWYGKDLLSAKKPRLEKKIKHNQLGTKEHFRMPDFQLQGNFDASDFLYQQYPLGHSLHPVVLVRYLRSYFESYNHKFRATIDRKMNYYLYQGNLFLEKSPTADEALILEIKFDKTNLEEADELLQQIPFRLTKNSKYVSAVLSNYW